MTRRRGIFLGVSVVLMMVLLTAAMFGQVTEKDNLYRYLSTFTEVFSLVRSSYVEEVPSDQLVDGAFAGVTDAIDEYSYYVPPGQIGQFKGSSSDTADTLGMVVTKRFGYGYVIAPVEGSPAQKAGVEAGDFIEKINDASTARMAIWQIHVALQDPKKPVVQLVVLRGGMAKREIFEVTRSAYPLPGLSTEKYGSVAYVKIPYFASGSAARFGQFLEKAKSDGVKKLIVDVRGNSGGSPDEAIKAADELLARGTITSLSGRRVDVQKWQADSAVAYEGDLHVLTDSSTAGPAEIFASAILGNQRGKLVGVSTYGKAGVQKLVNLTTGGALYITVGHYTTPELKPIKEQGVRPDVIVDLSGRSVPGSESDSESDKEDVILKKALSLFGEKLPLAEDKAAA